MSFRGPPALLPSPRVTRDLAINEPLRELRRSGHRLRSLVSLPASVRSPPFGLLQHPILSPGDRLSDSCFFSFLFFSFLSIRVTLVDPLPSSNFSVVPFEDEEEFCDRGFGTLFPLLVSFPSGQNSVRLIPMNSFELNEVYRASCPMLRCFLIRVSESFRLRQSFLWIS